MITAIAITLLILCVLGAAALYLLRDVSRSVRAGRADAANIALRAQAAAEAASEVLIALVELKKEHIGLTRRTYDVVHKLRETLSAVATRSEAQHEESRRHYGETRESLTTLAAAMRAALAAG